jgi:hypothetical protein
MTNQLPGTSGIAVAAILLLTSGAGGHAWAQPTPLPTLSDFVQGG